MTNKIKNISPWEYLFYPLMIALFFVFNTYPVYESDFFWHLNTGEWIWNNKSIPRVDPFTFTADPATAAAGSHRIRMILTQYWLGQLFLYGLWSVAGFKGIILARAVCYSAILAIIGLWSRRTSTGIVPFFFLFIVGAQLLRHSNERPQLFAFVLMPILLYILEYMRTSPKAACWQLPLLMLLWANIHGSFILGAVIIALYAVGHLSHTWSNTVPVRKGYIFCLAGSVGITLINPNGFWTLVEFFRTSPDLLNHTQEFQSPLISLIEIHTFDPYWLLLLPTLVLLVFHFRKMPVEHMLLLGSLAALSLSAGRYIPFFMFALPIILLHLPPITVPIRYEWLSAVLVLCLFSQFNIKSIFKFREHSNFPRQAVNFIHTSIPPGRIFNHSDWGGYISRYAPEHRVFIDSRFLVESLRKPLSAAMNGTGWQELFDRYDISTAILPSRTLDRNTSKYGKPAPLVAAMLKSSDWSPRYADRQAIVFVRNSPINTDKN